MYGREYNEKVYTLEASGGLTNSSLVMQDRETDSYWSLMKAEVTAGKLAGLRINELPIGRKMKWSDWLAQHPSTQVLSVSGREDAGSGYDRYFSSNEGFRGSMATDDRLKTKAPVFVFRWNGQAYAVPNNAIEGGRLFELSTEETLFLYRSPGAEMFESTLAFVGQTSGFAQDRDKWIYQTGGCVFDDVNGSFGEATNCPRPLTNGYDTFWYNWSLNNPETQVLGLEDK